MVQFKVYGQRQALAAVRSDLSDVLHAAAVDALGSPPDARFQRFFGMDAEDFPVPTGRSTRYTVVEVLMMAGRTPAAKKAFYARLYAGAADLGIDPLDLEVALVETPPHDWAIRGLPGDELPAPGRGRP